MIYMIYLQIPKSDMEKIKGISPACHNTNYEWVYDKVKNEYSTWYAWTDDKKIFKKFKNTRNSKYFKYSKVDDSEIQEDFTKFNNDIMLDEYVFMDGNNSISITTTLYEYMFITDDLQPRLIGDGSINVPDPEILNNDLVDLLDKFGFSYIFYTFTAQPLPFGEYENAYQDDLGSRYETFLYNLSYVTKVNSYITSRGFGNMPIINEFKAFIHYYGGLMSY